MILPGPLKAGFLSSVSDWSTMNKLELQSLENIKYFLNVWSSFTWFISDDYWTAWIPVSKVLPVFLLVSLQYLDFYLSLDASKIVDIPFSPLFKYHLLSLLQPILFFPTPARMPTKQPWSEGYDQKHDSTYHWIYFSLLMLLSFLEKKKKKIYNMH